MPKIIEDEQVYQAVIETIVENGYDGATTKQIAKAADMSEVTLFRKYGSKLQLVKQAIAYIMNQIDVDNIELYTGDVKKDLLRMVSMFQESAIKYRNFMLILFMEMFRHPELAELVQHRKHISEVFATVITRYQEEGKLKKEDPMHTVSALLGPLMLATLLPMMIPTRDVKPVDLERHVEYFLNGRLMK